MVTTEQSNALSDLATDLAAFERRSTSMGTMYPHVPTNTAVTVGDQLGYTYLGLGDYQDPRGRLGHNALSAFLPNHCLMTARSYVRGAHSAYPGEGFVINFHTPDETNRTHRKIGDILFRLGEPLGEGIRISIDSGREQKWGSEQKREEAIQRMEVLACHLSPGVLCAIQSIDRGGTAPFQPTDEDIATLWVFVASPTNHSYYAKGGEFDGGITIKDEQTITSGGVAGMLRLNFKSKR